MNRWIRLSAAVFVMILIGNLQLRIGNFYLASDAFSKVRDEFEPVHRQLQQVIVKSQLAWERRLLDEPGLQKN